MTVASRQNRVAAARLELPTDGWTTLDIRAGARVGERVTVRIGVENLTNELYATHINSLNPFTQQRIAEFGRSVVAGTEFGF